MSGGGQRTQRAIDQALHRYVHPDVLAIIVSYTVELRVLTASFGGPIHITNVSDRESLGLLLDGGGIRGGLHALTDGSFLSCHVDDSIRIWTKTIPKRPQSPTTAKSTAAAAAAASAPASAPSADAAAVVAAVSLLDESRGGKRLTSYAPEPHDPTLVARVTSSILAGSKLYQSAYLDRTAGSIDSVAVLSAGRVAVLGTNGALKVWSLVGRKLVHTFHGFTGSVCVLSDGKTLISQSRDASPSSTLRILHPPPTPVSESMQTLSSTFTLPLTAMCALPNNAVVAVGTMIVAGEKSNAPLHVWDVDTRQLMHVIPVASTVRAIVSLSSCHRPHEFVTGHDDGSVTVWDINPKPKPVSRYDASTATDTAAGTGGDSALGMAIVARNALTFRPEAKAVITSLAVLGSTGNVVVGTGTGNLYFCDTSTSADGGNNRRAFVALPHLPYQLPNSVNKSPVSDLTVLTD